jgi:hypothetical protein
MIDRPLTDTEADYLKLMRGVAKTKRAMEHAIANKLTEGDPESMREKLRNVYAIINNGYRSKIDDETRAMLHAYADQEARGLLTVSPRN